VAEKNLDQLIRTMSPQLNEGEWVFCDRHVEEALAAFREREGTTSIIEKGHADRLGVPYSFVAAWITLTVYSDLEAIGFLAVVTNELAAAGISCNVVSAYHHDHLFVPASRAGEAMRILRDLSCSRSSNTRPTSGSAS
jgi:uncharacterized protein